MIASFVQFTAAHPCPACGGIHQVDLRPALIEQQPHLFNWRGCCSHAEREVLVRSNEQIPCRTLNRTAMQATALKDAKVWEILGAIGNSEG